MRCPKWLGGCLNFKFNEIIVESPGGSILPSGTKTSRSAEHKVIGTGSKNFAGESLGVIVSGATPLIPGPMNPGYQRISTIYQRLIQSTDSLLKNLAPALQAIAT